MHDFALRILTAPTGKTHLFSAGQAGFIVKSASGQLLGVDLYLSECVERVEGHVGFKRLLPKILDPFELKFDVLVATHPHFDHFDMDAIPQMMSNGHTRLFASVDCQKEVARLNMTDRGCTYVKPGDCSNEGDFEIHFINCDHGKGAPDAVGLVIQVDGKKIFVAGDTCLREDWAKDFSTMGPFDVMIAPLNGAYGNLDERACARLSGLLNPGITIPCHYGMFASHGGNPGLFKEIMDSEYAGNAYYLMCMGEGITL